MKLRCRAGMHRWLGDSKERFCIYCGRHQMKEQRWVLPGTMWKDVWNVKEQGMLPALIWWYRMTKEQQDATSIRHNMMHKRMGGAHTYGDIRTMYREN